MWAVEDTKHIRINSSLQIRKQLKFNAIRLLKQLSYDALVHPLANSLEIESLILQPKERLHLFLLSEQFHKANRCFFHKPDK
jgi:hypothetical protein